MIKNYYKILEVSRYASDEVIKASYRAMAKKFHPDHYYGDKTYAERKMEEINEAYEVLGDPVKRKEYNEQYREYFDNSSSSSGTSTSITHSSGSYGGYEDKSLLKELGISSGAVAGIIITAIIVIGIIILAVCKWVVPEVKNWGSNSAVSAKNAESSSVIEVESDDLSDFVEGTPEYIVSDYIEISAGWHVGEEYGDLRTMDFDNRLGEAAAKIDPSKFSDPDMFTYLTKHIKEQFGNIAYKVSPAEINGEKADVKICMYYTDVPALANKITESTKKETDRLKSLKKTSEISGLYEETYNSELKNYEKQLSCEVTINLEKTEAGNWEIVSCSSYRDLANAFRANVIA